MRILNFGSLNVDYVYNVDHFVRPGETLAALSRDVKAGGKGLNQSVALARAGAPVCHAGCLGAGGEILKDMLDENGVDTSLIVREGTTPVTTMFVHEDGTRKSVTNEAHRYSFHPEREPERFTDARAVILGSLFRAPFDDPETVFSVVRSAKEAGQLVFADTKLPNFSSTGSDEIRDALAMTDYITPNEDEAKYYTGKDRPEEMADVFLRYGVKNVIIKLGRKGCYLKNAGEEYRLDARPVRAVDATGAGDHFIAGFVSELLRGKTQEEALRFANACGAICTTKVGAATALRNREQVLALIQK